MKSRSLRAIAILADISPADLERVEKVCQWRSYARGSQIFDRSSADRDAYFVVEGSVDIVDYSLAGREVSYATVSEGGFFGELSAIDGEPRSANVVAGAPCTLASLDAQQFRELIRNHPSVALHVLERLARIVRNNNERIMDLATLGAVERVHRELRRLAGDATSGAVKVDPSPTQTDIAKRAATTRETVARVMSSLQKSGLIRRQGRGFAITDVAALARVAERLSAGIPGKAGD